MKDISMNLRLKTTFNLRQSTWLAILLCCSGFWLLLSSLILMIY